MGGGNKPINKKKTAFRLLLAGNFFQPSSLERGSRHHLVGSTTKSAGRIVAEIIRSPVSSAMKMNTSESSSGQIGSYVQLQHQIHDALREQHPEWIEQNGDCPTCESYESRLVELLNLFQSNERKSAA